MESQGQQFLVSRNASVEQDEPPPHNVREERICLNEVVSKIWTRKNDFFIWGTIPNKVMKEKKILKGVEEAVTMIDRRLEKIHSLF